MKRLSAKEYASLSDVERCYLIGKLVDASWKKKARPSQIPGFEYPDTWITHAARMGRGAGKTRSGSEWVLPELLCKPGLHAGLLGPTFDHCTKVCIEGESGILACLPDQSLAKWREQKKQLQFVNGSVLTCYSSEHIRQMRGPQFHILWIDEPADLSHAWDCWEIARPAVRLSQKDGTPARIFITGTPKPVKLIQEIDKLHKKYPERYTLSVGSTKDNERNLDPAMVEELYERYAGSRYFMQEIEGLLLEQAEGALWSHETLANCRVDYYADQLDFDEIAIGIDPAVSEEKNADETGIIVAGRIDKDAYILADYSIKASALQWARNLVPITDKFGARSWVFEDNLAGPLIRDVLKGALNELDAPVKLVRVRAKGKKSQRAEPIAAMYEAGHVFHLKQRTGVPDLELLEGQMTTWEPSDTRSPDRIDALVHVVRHLLLRGTGGSFHRPGASSGGPTIRW